MGDLRPTLFLAQLSNLLAGNISIVHNVTGSSRTFMGEEAAGVDAVRIALARIHAGQSDLALVGGSHNGERYDLLLLYELGGHMLRGAFKPVWERPVRHGAGLARRVPRSGGARPRRGAQRQAAGAAFGGAVGAIEPTRRRNHGRARADVAKPRAAARAGTHRGDLGGDRGGPATGEERAWLASLPGVPVRATASTLGHGFEPQLAMNIALATLALGRQKLFPPADSSGVEQAYEGPLDQVAVTAVGHWRGEGMALVEAVR